MTPKTMSAVLGLATLLLASGAAGPAAASPPPPLEELGCVDLSTGEVACGFAQAGVCSGFGEGVATGPVAWTVRVNTFNPSSAEDHGSPVDSPAFAGGGLAAACTTASCTWAVLYANGEEVARSDVLC